MWECPDFFPMPNDTQNRYILKYSAGGDWYEIGTYDEKAEVGENLAVHYQGTHGMSIAFSLNVVTSISLACCCAIPF